MKLVHLSDLHIGKRINNYSLLDDQEHIFKKIIEKLKEIKPDGVIIAGDVFDRSNPSEEATALYDKFVTGLRKIGPVFIIAGNHDSGKRLQLFKNCLSESEIYIAGKYTGEVEKVLLETGDERANIFLLPFFSPKEISQLAQKEISNYEQAFEEIIKDLAINKEETNILVAHQLFMNTSKIMAENEQRVTEIGELEQISAQFLKSFDYVALGHLHNNQHLKNTNAYYSGTPIKFDKNDRQKYLQVVNIDENGATVEKIELEPLRDLKELTGSFDEILELDDSDDYVIVNLTNKKAVPNAKRILQEKFPHILQLKFNVEVKDNYNEKMGKILEMKPVELLESFYKSRGQEFTQEEREIAAELFELVKGEVDETA